MSTNKKTPKRGEVWFAEFPFEEDINITKPRPVIVLEDNEDQVGVLTIKVTSHESRDKWDYELFFWKEAKLRLKSVARVSQAIYLDLESFLHKIGDLHIDDLNAVDEMFTEYIKTLK